MLAIAGHLVQQNYRLPGMLSTSADLSFADMPNGLAALSKMPELGLFQIIAFIGFLELGVMKQKEGSFPGDMTLNGEPRAWTQLSEEVKEQKRVSPFIAFFTAVSQLFMRAVRTWNSHIPTGAEELCGMRCGRHVRTRDIRPRPRRTFPNCTPLISTRDD